MKILTNEKQDKLIDKILLMNKHILEVDDITVQLIDDLCEIAGDVLDFKHFMICANCVLKGKK